MTGGDWGQPAAASGQQQQPQGAQQCPITSGAVQRIYLYDTTPGSVVQVLDIRRLSTAGNSMAVVRFRLVVSDGRHYQQAVVVTELNARIESGEVETLGLIKLTEVSCQVVAGRRVIIILGLEVVSCRVAKLGAPSNVDPACAAKSASEAGQQGATEEERLMDEWCCAEFCNNAECVSAGGSCWFEWGVELVLQFFLRCGVAKPDTKAGYLVERCGVDPAVVAECRCLLASQQHGSPVFCHNALMDLIRRPGNGANVGRAQSVRDAAGEHVSLAQARLHDAQAALAAAQEALRREEQRLEQVRARGEATPWAADVYMLEGIARADADEGGASAARHCPEMEGVESEVEVGCLYAVSQRASVESSIMSHEACEALREQDLWEEDQQMEGFYTQCDVEAAYEQGL